MTTSTAPKSKSFPQAAILVVALVGVLGIWTLAKETLKAADQTSGPSAISFLQRSSQGVPAHLHSTRIETIRLRGHQTVTRETLTEGPRLHPGKQHFDSLEAYFPHEEPVGWERGGQRYVVGWKPVVSQHKCADGSEVEFVHHMNVLSLPKGKTGPSGAGQADLNDGELNLVASYDRGAAEFHLAPGYGIPFEHLTLEYHLLMPKCWDFSSEAVETSGMDLFVTSEKPENLAVVYGFTDESLHIEPGQGMAEQVTMIKPEALMVAFAAQLAARNPKAASATHLTPTLDAGINLLAMHLHSHELTKSKSFEVLNPDGSVLFRSQEEPGGYGPKQQSFITPQEKGWPYKRIEPGQALRVHCTYDTNKLKAVVYGGTSNGEEMCSALMILGGPSLVSSVGTVGSHDQGFLKVFGRTLQSALAGIKDDMQRLMW